MALVVGNANYRAQRLATSTGDADLVAHALQSAGFEVTLARDLGAGQLKKTFLDFIERTSEAGPDTWIGVYFTGFALQFGGDNYLLPVDMNAEIATGTDLPQSGVQLSEIARTFSNLRAKATFIILDAARRNPFLIAGQPPASGLAWFTTLPDVLIAYNASPGTVSPDVKDKDRYGSYASAVTEMVRDGNSDVVDLFTRVRMRVNEATLGTLVPWHNSGLKSPALLGSVAAASNAEARHTAPISGLPTQHAYLAALRRDTLDSYADYLADHWKEPEAKRIRALLAVRREAVIWQLTCSASTPDALWSYLEFFPEGPHSREARSSLARLNAFISPPTAFKRMEYEVPSPLPDEATYVDRPVIAFDDPSFGFEALMPTSHDNSGASSARPAMTVISARPVERTSTSSIASAEAASWSSLPFTPLLFPPSSLISDELAKKRAVVPPIVAVPSAYSDPVQASTRSTIGSSGQFPHWAAFVALPLAATKTTDPLFTGSLARGASGEAGAAYPRTDTNVTVIDPNPDEPKIPAAARPRLLVAPPKAASASRGRSKPHRAVGSPSSPTQQIQSRPAPGLHSPSPGTQAPASIR
ncbi:caspase family protein [Bradyrhizobium sp. ORS 86]|uniref:caspase family protein n=1 Tax=Bradyrhizobium sp. ORS 86 TaxID=1685970 RepID=UPI00388F6ACE